MSNYILELKWRCSIKQAHDLLEDAERIFLLGFGFDYTNISTTAPHSL